MTEDHDKALTFLNNNASDLDIHEFEPGEVIVNIYKLKRFVEDGLSLRNKANQGYKLAEAVFDGTSLSALKAKANRLMNMSKRV